MPWLLATTILPPSRIARKSSTHARRPAPTLPLCIVPAMAHGDDLASNVERSAWSLYRLCSISYSERDIDTTLACIQHADDEHPTNGIATRGYATSYFTAINLAVSDTVGYY